MNKESEQLTYVSHFDYFNFQNWNVEFVIAYTEMPLGFQIRVG